MPPLIQETSQPAPPSPARPVVAMRSPSITSNGDTSFNANIVPGRQRTSSSSNSSSSNNPADDRNRRISSSSTSTTTSASRGVIKDDSDQRQQQRRRPSSRSSVRFQSPNEVTLCTSVPNRFSYNEAEQNMLWVSHADHQTTIQNCKDIIRRTMVHSSTSTNMEPSYAPVASPRRSCWKTSKPEESNAQEDNDDDESLNTRGLEYMSPAGFDIINAKSKQTIQAVLEEQARLRQQHPKQDTKTTSGSFDAIFDQDTGDQIADKLARLVSRVSKHRHRIAQLAAMRDAQAAYGNQCYRARLTTSANIYVSQHNPRDSGLRKSQSGGSLAALVKEFNESYMEEPTDNTNSNWVTPADGSSNDSAVPRVRASVSCAIRPEPQRGMLRPSNSFGSMASSARRRGREPRRRRDPKQSRISSINKDPRLSQHKHTIGGPTTAAAAAAATAMA